MKLSVSHISTFLFLTSITFLSSCKKIPIQESFTIDKNDNLQYLDLKLKLDYKSSKDDTKAKVKVRMKKDSLIWASITASIGIEGLRCLITEDTVKVMNRLDKVYMVSDFSAISDKLSFKIDFDMLQAIILGNMPFEDYDTKKIRKEGKYLKITQKERGIDIENYINPNNKRLEKLLMTDPKTKNALQLSHKNFEASGSFILPKSTEITVDYLNKKNNQLEKTSITLEQQKAEASNEALRFPFNIPDKYERKTLK